MENFTTTHFDVQRRQLKIVVRQT